MAKAERQGWQTWERYKKAGIVSDDITFTDEKIIIDHAIGKTKETIGRCYPIDAAVAYSLASAGPEANLTSKQLVNQYTRMATAMMTQTVGYGTVPNPDTKSCGHDEINGFNISLPYPYLQGDYIVGKHSSSVSLASWLKNNELDHLLPYAKLRTNAKGMNALTTQVGYVRLLLSKKYTPLRLAIEEKLGTTTWLIGDGESNIRVTGTKGECKWKDDPSKKCGHHDGDYITDWVMVRDDEGGLRELWSRERGEAVVSSGWNHDQIESTFGYSYYKSLAPSDIILWSKKSRTLGNIIAEKEVIKEINKALRRMTARNFNVVRKEGLRNTATYTWKNWNWLYSLRDLVKQTSKKNRKEHDLVNGWLYKKYDSRMSYGHELAKFKWIPGKKADEGNSVPAVKDDESVKTFTVYMKATGGSYYNSGKGILPFRFASIQDAKTFVNMSAQLAQKLGAVDSSGRKWDAQTTSDSTPSVEKLKIMSKIHKLEMDSTVEPEVTPSPTEIVNALFWGSPQEFDKHVSYLNENCQPLYIRPKIVNKQEEITEVATE
jgi:hypothetical protein